MAYGPRRDQALPVPFLRSSPRSFRVFQVRWLQVTQPNAADHGNNEAPRIGLILVLGTSPNINPSEPRIWATSEPFARLLERFGSQVGLPRWSPGWLHHLGASVLGAFRPQESRRSPYDAFMLRFHDFLKLNDEFQERGPKRLWTFPPGSAWLAMTDACTYAELRGRFALEHSYFIAPQCLVLPDSSPAALLAESGGNGAAAAACGTVPIGAPSRSAMNCACSPQAADTGLGDECRSAQHEAVRECCVVGKKDAAGLEKPLAILVLKDGATGSSALEKALIAFAKGRLARYKAPHWVVFSASALPRNDRDKIDRKKLKAQHA